MIAEAIYYCRYYVLIRHYNLIIPYLLRHEKHIKMLGDNQRQRCATHLCDVADAASVKGLKT